jgi:hypothetical protein
MQPHKSSGSRQGRVAHSIIGTGLISLLALNALSQVIPPNRCIDWSRSGIPGGIPSANWPIYKTLSPAGGSDESVAIQAAINAAPAGSVILLNPGTYPLHRSSTVCSGCTDDYAGGVYEAGLCINKSVVLRGSGPDKTILQYGDGANFISMGNTYLSHSAAVFIAITGGATKGSTAITLANTTGISVGSYLCITQDNPNDTDGRLLVDPNGNNGMCSYCGHDLPGNVMVQIARVVGVNANTATLERPLYFTYTTSPKAFKLSSMVENAGLENLRLQPIAPSGTGIVFKNINLESCAHCWVLNVESDMAVDRSHIYLSDAYGCEIRNNYVNDGYNHNSGATYAIFLEFRNSENLIENNIIRKARHSTILNGCSGNVFGYNYLVDAHMGEYPNSLPESNTHGAHPYMNLWEGNVTPNIEFDFTHGSGSHNTAFRNYVTMTCTNPGTGQPMTGALYAMNIAYMNNYITILGNVIGRYGSSCTANAYEINSGAAVTSTIYKLGYFDDGGGTAPDAALATKVGQTILRGGNWDCKTNAVIWNNNAPVGSPASSYLPEQTLPASLYRTAKPAWFVTSYGDVAWPPVDPAAATKVNKIPAQLCYENGPMIGGVYNPSACYSLNLSAAGKKPDVLNNVFSIFPNRANSTVTIKIQNLKRPVEVSIYSMSGMRVAFRQIAQCERLVWHAANCPGGLYVMAVRIDRDVFIRRIQLIK